MKESRSIRIKAINGNTFAPMTAALNAAAQKVCLPNTEIVTTQPGRGPESIQSYYDEALAIPGIVEEILLSKDEFDGFVIACWGDPGLEAARELSPNPVVGISEASMYVANMLAARWGVITTGHRVRTKIEETVYKTGFGHRCVSIQTTGLSVEETETARESTLLALEKAGRLAIEEDGAEALCLGCAGMSGLDMDLQERLGVPIVDSVAAAVKMVESLVWLGKRTSKARTFNFPEKKIVKGYSDWAVDSL